MAKANASFGYILAGSFNDSIVLSSMGDTYYQAFSLARIKDCP
jgi:hypothetical protein